jgi:hypothetical protein
MSPTYGNSYGGTSVELTGEGFFVSDSASVYIKFGGKPVVNLDVTNDTYITFETPSMVDSFGDTQNTTLCLERTFYLYYYGILFVGGQLDFLEMGR